MQTIDVFSNARGAGMSTPVAVRRSIKAQSRRKPGFAESKADMTLNGVLPAGPVIITFAITLGSLIYQVGEAATKFIIKNLLDAPSAHAFVTHQRIKLV
jgi:hypothetical protein